MADRSAIEWTDSTFNPWVGCTQVSPACDNCYAAVSTPARTRGVEWGAGKPRQRTSAANWKLPLRWNAKPFAQCTDCGWRGDEAEAFRGVAAASNGICPWCGRLETMKPARRRVFCASLADWLDNEVPAVWLADLLSLIASTPSLDWQLLTKRIGNWRARLEAAVDCFEHRLAAGRGDNAGYAMARNWLLDEAPANVWIGATICNQAEADRDILKLRRVPATVRFLSIEPMLGHVDLFTAATIGSEANAADVRHAGDPWIDWVICGGESGPHARPLHPAWVCWLRDQCAAASVPFLLKQWGEWAPRAGAIFGSGDDFQSIDPKCKRWPDVVRLGEHGKDTWFFENCTPDMGEDVFMQKVGKKIAGRLLDGVTHDGYPEVRRADT